MAVKAVGCVKLKFRNNYVLVLNDVYCIPSISRNLISGSQFVANNGYSFSSNNIAVNFYYDNKCFGDASLISGYWHINCVNVSENQAEHYVFALSKTISKRKSVE